MATSTTASVMTQSEAKLGQITIIITSSPIPSNPSTEMLSQVLTSVTKSAEYFSTCPIILVFDGFTLNQTQGPSQFKSSKISSEESIAYKQFQNSVHELLSDENEAVTATATVATSSYDDRVGVNTISTVTRTILSSKVQIISHSIRVGFALAVRSALLNVDTPYILILQHDWAFTREIPIEKLLLTLDQEADMNYIGFLSRRSLDYVNCKINRAPSITAEILVKNDEPFTRLVFWYDRPHLARTIYYKTQVFGQKHFKRGDFIEDTFGHKVLSDCKSDGIEGWKKYGCWFWYPDNGLIPTVRHLNGRTFMDKPGYWTKGENGGDPYYKVPHESD